MSEGSVLVFVALLALTVGSFPKNLTKCKHLDEACLIKTANKVLQYGVKENTDLGLDVIDPMIVKKIDVDYNAWPVKVLINLSHINVTGISNARITKISGFRRDPTNGTIEMRLKAPIVAATARYDIVGGIYSVTVDGKGTAKMTLENINVKLSFKSTRIEKNGESFLHLTEPELKLNTTGGIVNLSQLPSFANSFLNFNYRYVIDVLRPLINDKVGKIFQNQINSVFSKTPYDQLFITDTKSSNFNLKLETQTNRPASNFTLFTENLNKFFNRIFIMFSDKDN